MNFPSPHFKFRFSKIALLCLVLLFQGCHLTPLSEAERKDFDHYSVVTPFDNSFFLVNTGPFVTNVEAQEATLNEGTIDEFLRQAFQNHLNSKNKTSAPFKSSQDLSKKTKKSLSQKLFESPDKWLEPVFSEANIAGVKYLISVAPSSDNGGYGPGRVQPGVGFVCVSRGNKSQLGVYMLVTAQVWDVQSKKALYAKSYAPNGFSVGIANECGKISPQDERIHRISSEAFKQLSDALAKDFLTKAHLY